MSSVSRELGSWAGARYEIETVVALTDRQLEALLVGWPEYFAVPREMATEELAARLNITSGPAARRVRVAQRQLFSSIVPSLAGQVVERVDGREEWVPPDGGDPGVEELAELAAAVGEVTAEQQADPIGRGVAE